MINLIKKLKEFSLETFGPDERTEGVCEHIKSELDEIIESDGELEEWVDVIILAMDGAWRSGHSPEDIENAIVKKLEKNKARQWPDYRNYKTSEAIMHIKTEPVRGHQVGNIIRYGSGSTALMRIGQIINNGNYRFYGRQCMGGFVGVYLNEIRSAGEEDIQIYRENLKY